MLDLFLLNFFFCQLENVNTEEDSPEHEVEGKSLESEGSHHLNKEHSGHYTSSLHRFSTTKWAEQFSGIIDAVIVSDLEGRICYVNEPSEAMFGFKCSDVVRFFCMKQNSFLSL